MRLLIMVVLLVGLGASSCEKYKLKQPAYLNFKWDFFNQQDEAYKPVITGGFFYINNVKIYGCREEGPEVEIEQDLPVTQTFFTSNGSLGLSMDIPVGDYDEFEVSLNVIDDVQPCLIVTGNYNTGTAIVPFRVQWKDAAQLKFHPLENFSLKKKKQYDMTIGVNVENLFSATTPVDWNVAQQTLENGVLTIVIDDMHNPKIWGDVVSKLPSSLLLKVQ